jgi:plastocyanin
MPSASARLLVGAAALEAGILGAIGVRHVDREAAAFAILFVAGIALLRFRRGTAGLVLLGLLAVDTEYWMATAAVANLQNGAAALSVLEALALAAVSALVVVGAVLVLIRRTSPRVRMVPGTLSLGVGAFAVALIALLVLAPGSSRPSGSQLAITTRNAAFSTTSLTAASGQVSIEVNNEDLFWHTFTIDKLGVNVALPVGGQKHITLNVPAGTYTFYCSIPGHRQAGMVGTLTVR